MTLAVAGPTSSQPTAQRTLPIVVLGTDALLAAMPATPVQLAHACLRAGYANVVPASWGDELIAAGALRRLAHFGSGPAIHCSCPIVAHRLLSAGGDLRQALVPLVPPPVAISRYVRALSQPTPTRITYVGNCPGAVDDAIDIRMSPDALLSMLGERQIVLDEQPRVFESVIPPDRRRYRSQPGGVPTVESLWSDVGARSLVEIDGEDFVGELAQHLLSGKNILIDVSARLGCTCAGAVAGTPPKEARAAVVALEPPRSTTPVVEEHAPIELDLPVPAAPRNPVDVIAAPPATGPRAVPTTSPTHPMMLGHRISPVRGFASLPEAKPPRVSSPVTSRPAAGSGSTSRPSEGKTIPRAYVARRRSSPRGIPAVKSDEPVSEPPALSVRPREMQDAPPTPVSVSGALSTRQLMYVLGAVALITVAVSTFVAVIVARSMR
jgi:hypothetical protein